MVWEWVISLGATFNFHLAPFRTAWRPRVVDRIVVNSGNLQLKAPSALGGIPVEVNDSGGINVQFPDAITGNITFFSGSSLVLNDSYLLRGTGTIALNSGTRLHLTGNASTNIFASSQTIALPGTDYLVRVGVDNIDGLDANVPDQGAIWEIAANGANITTSPAGTNLTGVQTITIDAGVSTNGGAITNDSGGSRALVGPITVGNVGATFAATTGTSLILLNQVTAGTGGVAGAEPIQVGALTPIDNVAKTQSPVTLVNNDNGPVNVYNASPRVIFEGGLKSGTVNLVTGSLYLDGLDTETKIRGDIIMGEGTRLYLGDGGSIAAGNGFGGAAPRRGDLTPLLVAPAGSGVTTGSIQLGNYARAELGLDPADPAWTASLQNGRGQVNQPFVVSGDLMPTDRRNFWVNRSSSTTTINADINNVTLKNSAVLSIQESGVDVRASIHLEGNATVAAFAGGGGGWDLKNVTHANDGVKLLNIGRADQPFSVTGLYGSVDPGIVFNNVYGRLEIRDGDTIPVNLLRL